MSNSEIAGWFTGLLVTTCMALSITPEWIRPIAGVSSAVCAFWFMRGFVGALRPGLSPTTDQELKK